MTDDGRGWQKDPQGHSQAGSQSSGNSNAAENLSQEDRSKGGKAAHDQGIVNEITPESDVDSGREGIS